jgi:hypothetical protein
MGYSALLVIGVKADQIIEAKTIASSYTKYNSDTGEPYEVPFKDTKYILNGVEYDAKDLRHMLSQHDLEAYPTQHSTEWILEDMVIGREVSKDDGGQCAEISIPIDGVEWKHTQNQLHNIGATQLISIFTIQEYS